MNYTNPIQTGLFEFYIVQGGQFDPSFLSQELKTSFTLQFIKFMYYKNVLAQMVDDDVIVLMTPSDFQRNVCYF